MTASTVKTNTPQYTKICGFCRTGTHAACPGAIRNGDGSVWLCPCESDACEPKRQVRCLTCWHTDTDDLDVFRWRCLNRDACDERLEARLSRDPVVQEYRQIKEKLAVAETETKTKTKTKTTKTGTCLVTGKPTKGGKFLPGMDARYVSQRVQEVVAGDVKEAAARTRIQNETGSEALLAKFDKSLALAQEKAEKREAAKVAKATAKSEKSEENGGKAATPAAKKAVSAKKAATPAAVAAKGKPRR